GDVMSESSVVRSSGTPSFMTSRPSDSRLASRISRTVIRPLETADVRAVTVRSVPHDPVLEGRRLVFEMALALLPEHPSDPVHNLVDRGTELVRLPVADDRPGPIGMYDDLDLPGHLLFFENDVRGGGPGVELGERRDLVAGTFEDVVRHVAVACGDLDSQRSLP